jgi:hypothetical protein
VGLYSVGGRAAATAASVNNAAAILWNPSSTKRLWVLAFEWCEVVAGSAIGNFIRVSTQGTPGSTITPDVDNAWEQDIAPPSGVVLNLAAYSVQPTFQGPLMRRIRITNAPGFGGMWTFDDPGICVPPGTGFGLMTAEGSLIPDGDCSFTWQEYT